MTKQNIVFVDPNLPRDIERFLPSILAQAIINKLQHEQKIHYETEVEHDKTA